MRTKLKKSTYIIFITIIIIGIGFDIYLIKNNNREETSTPNFSIYKQCNYERIFNQSEEDLIVGPLSINSEGDKIIFTTLNLTNPDFGDIWIFDQINNTSVKIYEGTVYVDETGGPKFSRDGNKIIFSTYRIDEELVTIDILIKNESTWNINAYHETIFKSNNSVIANVEFNHDNTKIIYSTYELNNANIWIINRDGANNTQLTSNNTWDGSHFLSPDGTKIIYLSIEKESEMSNEQIWIMDVDGKNKKPLLSNDYLIRNPTFIGNDRILYESSKISLKSDYSRSGNIWIFDLNTEKETLIFIPIENNDYYYRYPTISPDGNMISFLYDGHYYYIKDPDMNGIWEDSDDDGVADIIDKFPNDPEKGYIEGNYYSNENKVSKNDYFVSIMLVLIVISALIIMVLINEKKNFNNK